MTPLLELEGITKRYPGVVANDGISLAVAPGSIHAILGENGAGKSTLMKIIYGAVRPDAGSLRFRGAPVKMASPEAARALGIAMVFQHFSLFESLSVAENVWLGLPKSFTLARAAERVTQVSNDHGLELDPGRPLHTLSTGERQRVEIVRALLAEPKLLILDEPTSVLTPQAVEKLFGLLRKLAADGCSILYISHKLDEIRALCDRCTVLRHGRVTGECVPARETNDSLSRMMLGADPPRIRRDPPQTKGVALALRALSLPREGPFDTALERIELAVRSGEVVGIAGVSGQGQRELLAALSGEDPRAPAGSIQLFGEDVAEASPRARRARGLRFVPEERLGRGAVPALSLAQNTLLTRSEATSPLGLLRLDGMRSLASRLIERFKVKASGPAAPAGSLSGGNLQKWIVGRELDAEPRVLIVAQPTWGVDVGAAAAIRGELLGLRQRGCAVLVVSEDLDELFEICDRLVVIAKGRLSPSLETQQASAAQIGTYMSGLWPESPSAPAMAVAHA